MRAVEDGNARAFPAPRLQRRSHLGRQARLDQGGVGDDEDMLRLPADAPGQGREGSFAEEDGGGVIELLHTGPVGS